MWKSPLYYWRFYPKWNLRWCKYKLIDILKKHNLTKYIDKISIQETEGKFPKEPITIPNDKLEYLDKYLPFFTYYLDNGGTGRYKEYYPQKNKKQSSKTFLKKIVKIAGVQDDVKKIDRKELVKMFDNKRIGEMDISHYYFFNRDKQNLKILDNNFYELSKD